MVYEVIDTNNGFLIVSESAAGTFATEITKRQVNRAYLDELAAGLNHNAFSPLYIESLRVLGRYEYVI